MWILYCVWYCLYTNGPQIDPSLPSCRNGFNKMHINCIVRSSWAQTFLMYRSQQTFSAISLQYRDSPVLNISSIIYLQRKRVWHFYTFRTIRKNSIGPSLKSTLFLQTEVLHNLTKYLQCWDPLKSQLNRYKRNFIRKIIKIILLYIL